MNIAEAEFLDVIGTKFVRGFLLAIHSHLYKRIREEGLFLYSLCMVLSHLLYNLRRTDKMAHKWLLFPSPRVGKGLFPFLLSYEPNKRDVVLLLSVAVVNIKPL